MGTVPLLPNGVPPSVGRGGERVSSAWFIVVSARSRAYPLPFPALSRHCAPSRPLGCCVNLLTPGMPGSHSGAKCSPAYEYLPSRALSRLLQRQGAMSRPVEARTCCVNQCLAAYECALSELLHYLSASKVLLRAHRCSVNQPPPLRLPTHQERWGSHCTAQLTKAAPFPRRSQLVHPQRCLRASQYCVNQFPPYSLVHGLSRQDRHSTPLLVVNTES